MDRRSVRLGEIITRLGGELIGDPEASISQVATLRSAGPQHISFFAQAKYREELAQTRAGAVIVSDAERDATALPQLMQQLFGERGRWLVALLGYLACFASINVYVQGFARLIWSLAEEGKLPARLAGRNRHGVPGPALLLVVAVCALCAALAQALQLSVDDLIRYANGNFIIVYLLSMAAGVWLLRGLWRGVAALATLLCLLVLAALGRDALYALGLLAVLALWRYWREERFSRE